MGLARPVACAALVLVMLGGIVGCDVGGPTRASTIQNLNGISDDISAVDMTRSANTRARDPNTATEPTR